MQKAKGLNLNNYKNKKMNQSIKDEELRNYFENDDWDISNIVADQDNNKISFTATYKNGTKKKIKEDYDTVLSLIEIIEG